MEGRLYISPTNANEGLTVVEGDNRAGILLASTIGIGGTRPAPQGIDRFSTFNGLKALIDNRGLLGTTLDDTSSAATLEIYNLDPLETLTFEDRISESSVRFGEYGAESNVFFGNINSNFIGATNGQSFTLQSGANPAVTLTFQTNPLLATEFNSLEGLRVAINNQADFDAQIDGTTNQLQIQTTAPLNVLSVTNGTFNATSAAGPLGLSVPTTAYLGALTMNDQFSAATTGDGFYYSIGSKCFYLYLSTYTNCRYARI